MGDLLPRTKKFALDVLAFTRKMPRGMEEDGIRRQLVRCGPSVGAHYRAAQRGRSKDS